MPLKWFRRRKQPDHAKPAPPGPYVFISYSRRSPDAEYVAHLATVLPADGVPLWYDQHIISGDRWEQEIRARVDGCAALLVVMSPNSEASPWVQLEVGRARYRRRPLRPVLIDGQPFERLADIQFEATQPGRAPSAALLARLRQDVADAMPPLTRSAKLIGAGFPTPNPNFVGREQLLLDLETNLYWGRSVAVEALQGTGGVGKTQLGRVSWIFDGGWDRPLLWLVVMI